MKYYSTNSSATTATLEEAVLQGLAPDGGLYVPEHIPSFTHTDIQALRVLQERLGEDTQAFLQEVAFYVLDKWFGAEIDAATLRSIAVEAQSFPIPLREVGPFTVLELFHGPTLAFKDVAARNLARIMGYFLERRGERALLLVATSGDTGGAIADGFANQNNIDVALLYPRGRVSKLQEEQMTRVAGNITPIEVDGVFDDCQALVKRAFVEPGLRDLRITSANSINIARLVPQIIYYVYAYFLLHGEDLEVTVPSGNFGNLTAGLLAQKMGAGPRRFIAATNANDAVVHYYESGDYRPQETVQTLSTAMDVGNPSNFARILELVQHRHADFRQMLRAYSVADRDTVETIQRVYERYNYLLCPHTAVGWTVAERHGATDRKQVVVATAAPVKFAAEIRAATGLVVEDAGEIARLQARPRRKISISNRWEALEDLLLHLAREGGTHRDRAASPSFIDH